MMKGSFWDAIYRKWFLLFRIVDSKIAINQIWLKSIYRFEMYQSLNAVLAVLAFWKIEIV